MEPATVTSAALSGWWMNVPLSWKVALSVDAAGSRESVSPSVPPSIASVNWKLSNAERAWAFAAPRVVPVVGIELGVMALPTGALGAGIDPVELKAPGAAERPAFEPEPGGKRPAAKAPATRHTIRASAPPTATSGHVLRRLAMSSARGWAGAGDGPDQAGPPGR